MMNKKKQQLQIGTLNLSPAAQKNNSELVAILKESILSFLAIGHLRRWLLPPERAGAAWETLLE